MWGSPRTNYGNPSAHEINTANMQTRMHVSPYTAVRQNVELPLFLRSIAKKLNNGRYGAVLLRVQVKKLDRGLILPFSKNNQQLWGTGRTIKKM
jgi:ABC-type taurine transport system ATPase subunit